MYNLAIDSARLKKMAADLQDFINNSPKQRLSRRAAYDAIARVCAGTDYNTFKTMVEKPATAPATTPSDQPKDAMAAAIGEVIASVTAPAAPARWTVSVLNSDRKVVYILESSAATYDDAYQEGCDYAWKMCVYAFDITVEEIEGGDGDEDGANDDGGDNTRGGDADGASQAVSMDRSGPLYTRPAPAVNAISSEEAGWCVFINDDVAREGMSRVEAEQMVGAVRALFDGTSFEAVARQTHPTVADWAGNAASEWLREQKIRRAEGELLRDHSDKPRLAMFLAGAARQLGGYNIEFDVDTVEFADSTTAVALMTHPSARDSAGAVHAYRVYAYVDPNTLTVLDRLYLAVDEEDDGESIPVDRADLPAAVEAVTARLLQVLRWQANSAATRQL